MSLKKQLDNNNHILFAYAEVLLCYYKWSA